MLFGGIDIGSRAAKVVVMQDDQVFATAIIDTGPESAKTARRAMEAALSGTGRGGRISLANAALTVWAVRPPSSFTTRPDRVHQSFSTGSGWRGPSLPSLSGRPNHRASQG